MSQVLEGYEIVRACDLDQVVMWRLTDQLEDLGAPSHGWTARCWPCRGRWMTLRGRSCSPGWSGSSRTGSACDRPMQAAEGGRIRQSPLADCWPRGTSRTCPKGSRSAPEST